MITTRQLIAGFLLLPLLFAIPTIAHSQKSKSASRTAAVESQPQVAAGFDEQAAGFENPAIAFTPADETKDLIGFGMVGFIFGAAVVVLQTLRRWIFPASVRTIVLEL
jgi:hypothetical protein